jgi:hypothetical protein
LSGRSTGLSRKGSRQAAVDALDRGVRFVDVHLDDEFELLSEAISRQNQRMAKSSKTMAKKNGRPQPERRVSKLGKELRKLADAYAASGGKLLNRRELEREIAERRGLR